MTDRPIDEPLGTPPVNTAVKGHKVPDRVKLPARLT